MQALALLALERLFPLRKPKSRFAARLVINSVISGLALSVAFIVVKPVATGVLQRVTENHWGLAPIMSTNLVMQGIVAFLLMDLSFYYWHRANHAWPLLWRFHNAHHIDPDLDVTTAVRFHFVEIGYSSAFRALQVALIGGPPLTFIAYELIFQLNTASIIRNDFTRRTQTGLLYSRGGIGCTVRSASMCRSRTSTSASPVTHLRATTP